MKRKNYWENSWDEKMAAEKFSDHVDVSRLLKQLPVTVWELLLIPMYVPLCNISSNSVSM